MEKGGNFIQQITGDWPVYPGHPLVLAAAIMNVFPDYESASLPTPNGWSSALGDSRIPGAGDHVGAAMRCLKIGSEGGTVEEMIEYAVKYWVNGNAGGHHRYVAKGSEQATAIEPTFRELVATWIKAPAVIQASANA